jgi:hypothetical protein
MASKNYIGAEVTFAAILAAQECGDFEAIEAAETGSSAWDDYVARYIRSYNYEDFTLALLTKSQSADLRWQVLQQAALLPQNRVSAGKPRARQADDERGRR